MPLAAHELDPLELAPPDVRRVRAEASPYILDGAARAIWILPPRFPQKAAVERRDGGFERRTGGLEGAHFVVFAVFSAAAWLWVCRFVAASLLYAASISLRAVCVAVCCGSWVWVGGVVPVAVARSICDRGRSLEHD